MIVKIYVLIDPTTDEIRYVGRTSKPNVHIRLVEHIAKAKNHISYKRRATPVINWINKLLSEDKVPIIKEIEEVEGWKESHIRERELIVFYKQTCKLTNLMDKGMGHYNAYVDEETKQKISSSLKKRYKEGMPNRGYEVLRKAVYQFSLDGEFIKEFPSIAIAAKELNMNKNNIGDCCGNNIKRKVAGGFYFSFKKEFPDSFVINKNYIKIICENILTKEVSYFNTAAECGRSLNTTGEVIRWILKTESKIYNNIYKLIHDER